MHVQLIVNIGMSINFAKSKLMLLIILNSCMFTPEALVGLERTFYNASKNDVVEVCAVVYTPDIFCPINFAFDVRVSTSITSSSGASSRGNDSTSDDIAGEGNTGEGSADEGSAGEGNTGCGYYTTIEHYIY